MKKINRVNGVKKKCFHPHHDILRNLKVLRQPHVVITC